VIQSKNLTHKTAMVVDDSMILRKKLTKVLEELDYNVVAQAKTGQEAVDMYDKFKPGLVTMDITMPDMEGTEAVQLIMTEYPDANIIMATSHKDPRMVKQSLLNGAKGYIVKPITKTKLEDEIAKISGLSDSIDNEDDLLDD
jgi:two-component system chemotaxis response regulator CheY